MLFQETSCLSFLSSWSWSLATGRGRWVFQTGSPPAPFLPSPEPQKYLCRAWGCGPRTAAPQTWWTWRSRWRTLWQTFQWPAPQTCTDLQCFNAQKRKQRCETRNLPTVFGWCGDVPVSGQKTQTGGADFIAEYHDLYVAALGTGWGGSWWTLFHHPPLVYICLWFSRNLLEFDGHGPEESHLFTVHVL